MLFVADSQKGDRVQNIENVEKLVHFGIRAWAYGLRLVGVDPNELESFVDLFTNVHPKLVHLGMMPNPYAGP